jgi:hypothetical protein
MAVTDIGSRLIILRQERLPLLDRSLINMKARPELDQDGMGAALLSAEYRFLAVADYILDHDIESFGQKMGEASRFYLDMQRRYDNGDPIDWSFMSMIGARPVFDALAGGHRDLAEGIAARMGGREPIEQRNDRPIDIALGYAVKWLILDEPAKARSYIEDLAAICRYAEFRNFAGYPFVLQAVLDDDGYSLETAFTELLDGHRRDTADLNGLFWGSEDEVLACWALGLANLARWRGLDVTPEDQLIPKDLLVAIDLQP